MCLGAITEKRNSQSSHCGTQFLFADSGGVGHGSACQKKRKKTKQNTHKKNNKKDEDFEVWCVTVVVLFLYRGLWGVTMTSPQRLTVQ